MNFEGKPDKAGSTDNHGAEVLERERLSFGEMPMPEFERSSDDVSSGSPAVADDMARIEEIRKGITRNVNGNEGEKFARRAEELEREFQGVRSERDRLLAEHEARSFLMKLLKRAEYEKKDDELLRKEWDLDREFADVRNTQREQYPESLRN